MTKAKKINWKKPLMTRDSRQVVLIERGVSGVTIAVKVGLSWEISYCLPDGRQFKDGRETSDDVVNVIG